MLEWRPGQKQQQQYALPGREAPLLLQSRVNSESMRGCRRCPLHRSPAHLPTC